jgi:hypothetical protein
VFTVDLVEADADALFGEVIFHGNRSSMSVMSFGRPPR